MWGNLTLFHRGKSIEKNIGKRWILTQSIGKNIFRQAKATAKISRKDKY